MTVRDYQFVIARSNIARDLEMLAMDIWHDEDLTLGEKLELGSALGAQQFSGLIHNSPVGREERSVAGRGMFSGTPSVCAARADVEANSTPSKV